MPEVSEVGADFPLSLDGIPDVSDLSSLMPRLVVLALVGGTPSSPPSARGLFHGGVRLVDFAWREYMAMREDVRSRRDDLGLLLQASSHAETCAVALHRANLHVAGLRSQVLCPALASSVPRPRKAAVVAIHGMRDAIQHTDDRMADLSAGTPVFLAMRPECISLAGHHLRYQTMVEVLRSLHCYLDAALAELAEPYAPPV